MARIRTVKPTFWTSEPVAACSRDARLLLIGLWNYIDDEGRGVDNARLIGAAVFPLDEDATDTFVESLLAELAAHRRIVRYVVDGRRYLAVPNWHEHQRVSHPRPSDLPEPASGTIREDSGAIPEPLRPEGKGIEGKGVEGKPPRRLASDERTGIIRAAARILVNRRDDNRLQNPAYLAAAVNGTVSDFSDDAHRHLTANPELTAEALAELLAPTNTTRKLPTCSDCRAAYTGHGCQLGASYLECPMVGPMAVGS